MDLTTEDWAAPVLLDNEPLEPPLTGVQVLDILYGPRDGGGAPERALMRAMLQDVVLCLVLEAPTLGEHSTESLECMRKRLCAEARYWISSQSRAWPFAFECVCDALGLDSGYMRERLLAMADRIQGQQVHSRAAHNVRVIRRGGSRRRKHMHFMHEHTG